MSNLPILTSSSKFDLWNFKLAMLHCSKLYTVGGHKLVLKDTL